MQEKLSNGPATISLLDSIREKITLLSTAGFVWKEIAALTDIPKKVIKKIAKGEHIVLGGNLTLKEEDYKWLATQFDESIKRLCNCVETMGIEKSNDINSDTKPSKYYTLDIQKLSFFVKKDIDDLLIRIEGVKFYEAPAPVSQNI